jgi:hypothetical protein
MSRMSPDGNFCQQPLLKVIDLEQLQETWRGFLAVPVISAAALTHCHQIATIGADLDIVGRNTQIQRQTLTILKQDAGQRSPVFVGAENLAVWIGLD